MEGLTSDTGRSRRILGRRRCWGKIKFSLRSGSARLMEDMGSDDMCYATVSGAVEDLTQIFW